MKRKEITEKIKDAQKEELESCCMYMLEQIRGVVPADRGGGIIS